jgi:hypothetical protein
MTTRELDDLLDDIGGNDFVPSRASSQRPKDFSSPSRRHPIDALSVGCEGKSSIDALLDEIGADSPPSDRYRSKAPRDPPSQTVAPRFGFSTSDSSVALIGGPRAEREIESKQGRAGLICTKCDFQVARFPGCRWAENANYLFFRNYMPDARKMREMQVKAPEYAAYACQCSWQSVRGIKAIRCRGTAAAPHGNCGQGGDMKWVLQRSGK